MCFCPHAYLPVYFPPLSILSTSLHHLVLSVGCQLFSSSLRRVARFVAISPPRPHLCLTGLSSAVACCSELGPRPTCRRVRVRICWRRLLRLSWTARKSNQSILKEINPEYSLEELTLKQKLPYFGHLMRRTDSLEKILMLGKIEGGRRKG